MRGMVVGEGGRSSGVLLYLRLIHQPCWLYICTQATVTVKMVHCCDTLVLKTKTKSCAINKKRLLQTSFAKSCLISWHF